MNAKTLRVEIILATLNRAIENGQLDRQTLKPRSGYQPPTDLLIAVLCSNEADLDRAVSIQYAQTAHAVAAARLPPHEP